MTTKFSQRSLDDQEDPRITAESAPADCDDEEPYDASNDEYEVSDGPL